MVNSTTTRTAAADNAFTPFGERYALNSYTGYVAGMLMQYPYMTDGYQADERLYHDGQGRWVSPDPAGLGAVDLTNPQSLNRYVYVMNNPLNNTDPSGLDAQSGTICYTTPVSSWGEYGPVYGVTTTCATFAQPPTPPGTDYGGGSHSGGGGSLPPAKRLPQRLTCAANFGNGHSVGALFGGGKVATFLGGNTFSSLTNLGLALTNNGPAPQNPGTLALSGPALGLPVNDVLRLTGRQTIPQLTSASGFIRGQALQAVFKASTGPAALTSIAQGGEVALQGGITAGEYASGIALAKLAYDGAAFLYGYFGKCQ